MRYLFYKAQPYSRKWLVTKKPLSLKRMQELVGGYVEFTHSRTHRGEVWCVNEEGLLLGLPRNPICPEIVGNIIVGKFITIADGSQEFVGL